jgi:hypothetical protein
MGRVRNSDRECVEENCTSPVYARDYCQIHYTKYRYNGSLETKKRHVVTVVDRKLLVGDCLICGPIKLYVRSDGGIRCGNVAVKPWTPHPDHKYYQYMTKYGINKEQYLAMLEAQNNSCAICEMEFTATPHIDHDHVSNHVRGLLCRECNYGLGNFRDNVTFLASAISYLEINGA